MQLGVSSLAPKIRVGTLFRIHHRASADDFPAVGVNFAILIAWTAISCITLPLVQWYVRRQDVLAAQAQAPVVGEAPTGDSAHTVTLGRAAGSTGSLRRVSTDRNPQDSDSRDETLPMSSQSQFSRTRSVDGERGV